MISSSEIKRQLPDEELLSFGYMPDKTAPPVKVFYPGEPVTNEMIMEYYHKITDNIVPYILKRPQDVKKDFTFKEAFFTKEGDPDLPSWLDKIKGLKIHKDDYTTVVCNSINAFKYVVNQGLMEINLWHSIQDTWDYPDYIVFDIDPSPQNTFSQVKRVARILKSLLDKAGVESFCKTSGGTGLHVFVPAGGRYPYSVIHDFAYTLAMLVHKRIPEITCLEKKTSLKKHRIFIDYTQNKKGKTIAGVYSVRALPGAPVSTPIAWEELKDDLNPFDFNIFTVPERIEKHGDLFTGLLGEGINIQKCIQLLGSVE